MQWFFLPVTCQVKMNYSASLLPSGCTVSKACTFPALHSIPGSGWRRRHWSVSYYCSSMSQYPCCTWQSYPSGSNGVNFIINGKSGNDYWLSMSKKLVMHRRKANITLLLLRTRKSYHLFYLFADAHESDATSCQNLPLCLNLKIQDGFGWI